MTITTLAIGLLALAGLVVLLLLVVNANRDRSAIEDVPPGQRPGYSDDELEKVVIERYMAWGLVFTLIFAIGFPLYWWMEPQRMNQAQEDFVVEDIVQGEREYANLCAECHGADMGGGAAPDPHGEGQWPAPALNNIAERYVDNPNVVDLEDFVWQTIQRGRPGTPMPEWGAAYGGPLTDQQIDAITRYILLNQAPEGEAEENDDDGDQNGEDAGVEQAADVSGEQLYTQNCAKCHGADLEGRVAPTLIGVFERHSDQSILQILRTGIFVPTGPIMPPWQVGYQYEDTQFDDQQLQAIIEYLQERQPDDVEYRQDSEAVVPPPRGGNGDDGDDGGDDGPEAAET